MSEPPSLAYRPEDVEPDIENNPDSDAGLNRERVRKSQQAAGRIEVVMMAVLLVLFVSAFFAYSAQAVHYEKFVLAFTVGLFVGARLVSP